MSDISQITLGGVTYNIKDAIARQQINTLDGRIDDVSSDVQSLIYAVGTPLVASTVSQMTDHTKIYVYTGSESGYTSGNWYYWNGSDWTSGGIYNSTAFNTDNTLSVSGAAADAKATGDEIDELKHNFQMIINSTLSLESGTFSDVNGTTKVSNTARIRTAKPLDVLDFDTIVIAEGYQAYIFLLDSSLQKISTVTWTEKITKSILSTASYINIAIRKTATPSADISGDIENVIAGTKIYIKADSGIPEMEKNIADLETDMTGIQSCFKTGTNNNKIIYDTIETETTQAGSRVVYADIYLEQNKSYVFRFWYNGGWYHFSSTQCTIESNGSVIATLFSYDAIPNTGLDFTWNEASGVYKIHTLSGQAIGWTAQTIADGLMVYESEVINPTYVQGEILTMAKNAERFGGMTASEFISVFEDDIDEIKSCFEDVINNNKIIYTTIETSITQSESRVVYADIYLEKDKSYTFRFWYNGDWYHFASTRCTIESNGSVIYTLFSYDDIPSTGLQFTWTEESGIYKIHTLSGSAIGWSAQTIADGLMIYDSNLHNPTYVQGEIITIVKDSERVGGMTVSEIISSVTQSNVDYSLIAYGDSLTQGAGGSGVGYRYLDVCKTALNAASDLPLGYGGSAAKAIAFTAGALSAYIPPNSMTFSLKYADLTTNVSIALNLLNGKTVIVNGVEYTISQTGATEYSLPDIYVPSNMYLPVVVKNSRYTADIYVIWVGTNDHDYKWDIIDAMIAKLPHEQYVVMGLTRLGTDTTVENEQKAYERYGSHFFNTRVQIIANAFDVLNETPTAEDTAAMASGLIPPSLLTDNTHFNDDGYEVIGKLLALHIKSLGYTYQIL